MPSVTALSQYTLQNLGPLTTTFTAPESCATLEPPVALARTDQPSLPYWQQECDEVDDSFAACLPSGRAYFDIYKNESDATRPPNVIPYFSPGLHCPDSWTTAGVAVKNAEGSIVSTSGVYAAGATASPSPTSGPVSGSDEWFKSQLLSFDGTSYASPGPSSGSDEYFKDKLLSFDGTSYASPEKTPSPADKRDDDESAPSGSDDYFKTKLLSFDGTSYASPEKTPSPKNGEGSGAPRTNPVPNILLEALGAGETAVACCPSGYTAQENRCYSNTAASAYTAPTGCQRGVRSGQATWVPATFTWDGEAVTGASEASWTGTAAPYYTVISTTFPTGTAAATAESYTGVVDVAMLTLVHGGSGGGNSANSTEEQPAAGESSGSGSDDAENAAAPGVGAAGLGKVVVAWVAAALVGALVVFPS